MSTIFPFQGTACGGSCSMATSKASTYRLRPRSKALPHAPGAVSSSTWTTNAADDGVVVLAVAEADEALDAPELHAGPVRRVRQADAHAVLPVRRASRARPTRELLERRGVLLAPLAPLGGLPVVLRRRAGATGAAGGACGPIRRPLGRAAAGA